MIGAAQAGNNIGNADREREKSRGKEKEREREGEQIIVKLPTVFHGINSINSSSTSITSNDSKEKLSLIFKS